MMVQWTTTTGGGYSARTATHGQLTASVHRRYGKDVWLWSVGLLQTGEIKALGKSRSEDLAKRAAERAIQAAT